MAGLIAGEMSVAANAIGVEDVARGGTYAYTHTRVEANPLYLSGLIGEYMLQPFEHSAQLLQPAGEETIIRISYTTGVGDFLTGGGSIVTGPSAGVWVDGPDINHGELGQPVPAPTYDDPAPRFSENRLYFETQNDIGGSQVQAFNIEETTYQDEAAAEPPYETTCVDTEGPDVIVDGDMEAAGVGAWTVANATLTKEVIDPYSGSQNLRVTKTAGAATAGISWQTILTVGEQYRITGQFRTDGSTTAQVRDSGGAFSVTTTSTGWTAFDETFIAAGVLLQLRTVTGTGAIGTYVEFDDVTVEETRWTFFEPNRSCSAFFMQRILAGNINKLTATSMSAQTVAL
jgi:hypothetical protein